MEERIYGSLLVSLCDCIIGMCRGEGYGKRGGVAGGSISRTVNYMLWYCLRVIMVRIR